MIITGIHIQYYHLCHRKLWLFAHGLQMEHRSSLVAEGKWIHETSYAQRAKKYKEVALEGIKIDHFDAQNRVVHEIKKTKKKEQAHIAQLQYYLWVLEQQGIRATGLLEYPVLRETQAVELDDKVREVIPSWKKAIEEIISQSTCPPLVKKSICKRCSYHEFCYADEL